MTQTALVRAVSKWGPRIILLQLLIIAGLIWILWTFNQNSVQGRLRRPLQADPLVVETV